MIKKITAYMKQHHMVQKGGHICVGVSGGADSVCLFRVLDALRKMMGFTISVVHIEHGIRGQESLDDMEFVKNISDTAGIPFSAYAYPVEKIAADQGLSVEEAGRKVRYEAFARETARYGRNTKIALAHHADDNAETVLFRLCRGSGIDGLRGIRPVRDNIIRPLLCVTRKEIEEFLKREGHIYRTDATNADVIYSRNRIRSLIMPELLKINQLAAVHMNLLAEDAGEISAYLRKEADCVIKDFTKETGDGRVTFEIVGLLGKPSVLQKCIMLELLEKACGRRKDVTREHLTALLKLSEGETGKYISLPYGMVAEKSYGSLILYSETVRKKADDNPEGVILEGDSGEIHFSKGLLRYQVRSLNKKDAEIPKNMYTKWFDYDKIKDRLYFRTRMPGDYFELNVQRNRQKLKDYLMNEKVPRQKRGQILLLAEGSHILWIVGYRISAYYKVTEQTKHILEVRYMEERV